MIQQNCERGYECIISLFKAELSLNVAVVYIQERFLGNQSISQSKFNLYWPSKINNCKDIEVLTIVKKNILHRLISNNKIDLVSHSYYSVLNIKKLHPISRKILKKTRIVNLYNNKFGRGQI